MLLRLAEKLLRLAAPIAGAAGATEVRQAREVARLVDQHLRLVLERGDLVVDLLQRAGGLQHVLARSSLGSKTISAAAGCDETCDGASENGRGGNAAN